MVTLNFEIHSHVVRLHTIPTRTLARLSSQMSGLRDETLQARSSHSEADLLHCAVRITHGIPCRRRTAGSWSGSAYPIVGLKNLPIRSRPADYHRQKESGWQSCNSDLISICCLLKKISSKSRASCPVEIELSLARNPLDTDGAEPKWLKNGRIAGFPCNAVI